MPRVPAVEFEKLTPEQKQIYKKIAGPRNGEVGGPYTVWLRNPVLADAMNRVFDVLRTNGKLDKRLMELIALIISRYWSCQYVWAVHENSAIEAGLSPEVMVAIREGRRPNLVREDEQVIYDAVNELCETRALTDKTYGRALAAFGLDLLIEIVTNAARYTQAAMVVNAFELPAPEVKYPFA